MRHMIGVTISDEYVTDIGVKLVDVPLREIYRFNPCHAHIIGIERSLLYDEIVCYLIHNEFPVVPSGCAAPLYNIPAARARFPFLFVDTNPVLYRKFNSVHSENRETIWRVTR